MNKYQQYYDNFCLSLARVFVAAPFAPGTFTSLLAAILAPVLFLPLNIYARIAVLLFLFLLGAYVSTKAEKMLNKKDPGDVTIDELVGQWLTYLLLSYEQYQAFSSFDKFLAIAVGFVFFRIFDIVKPFPIKRSEKWLPAGYGIMIDDVFAAIYAMIHLGIIMKLVKTIMVYFNIVL